MEEILKLLEDIPNEDGELERLEKAMNYFCSMYDICEGFKHAIRMTLEDQFNNHASEIEQGDIEKLKAILTE